MKKLLFITSDPSNDVAEKFIKAGKEKQIEIVLAVTENFSVTYEGGKANVVYNDKENDIKLSMDDFAFCVPRLSDEFLHAKYMVLKGIQDNGLPMLNTAESMINCQEKIKTENILNTANIKTPKTKLLFDSSQINEDDFTFPVIVKTNTGSAGVGVMKIDSYESLKSVLQVLCKEKIDCLVQEFIEHKFSFRTIMLGGELLAANKRFVAKNDFRTNSHQSGKIVKNTEKYEPSENEIEISKKIGELLECQICAIDYLLSEDGTMTVLEVNGSPGLEAIQEDYPDKDLAETVLEFCLGKFREVKETDPIPNPEEEKSEEEEEKVEDEKEADKEAPEKDEKDAEKGSEEAEKDTIEETEHIIIKRLNNDEPVEAKIDTGAGICSIEGDDIEISEDEKTVKFTFLDTVYRVPIDRMIKIIKADDAKSRRAIIKLDVVFHDETYKDIDITVADRSNLEFSFLVGKNLLALIDKPIKIELDDEEKPAKHASKEEE
jgi:RimK family alpha-L-glutamate ligase